MTFTLLSCHPFLIMIFLTPEKLGDYSQCATTPGLRWALGVDRQFETRLAGVDAFRITL
jgi:hypothetical protein